MKAIDRDTLTEPIESQPLEVAPPVLAPRRRRWWPFLLAALAVLIALSLLSPTGRHQWALSIIRQPATYTTLSFQDAAALPHDVKTGAVVHLAVTVVNHEGRRIHYRLVLSSANLNDVHAMKALHQTDLTVPSGALRTVSISARPACTTSSCELQVSLPGHAEAIDVLLDVRGHRG